MTLGAGSVSRGLRLVTRSGAETGGGTTLMACEPGMRSEVISRCAALGGGGTTVAFIAGAFRILS